MIARKRGADRVVWRWQERDFGLRFRGGKGKRAKEYYQAARAGEFYVVSKSKRKLSKAHADALCAAADAPTSPRVVDNPWRDYGRGWDWVQTADGICLNYAGCLGLEVIHRREDEGVARAMRYVAALVGRPQPAPLTVDLVKRVHTELMGDIYPFAGQWREVAMHKGAGVSKWPLPPGGIGPQMDKLGDQVFSRSPL